MTALVRHGLDAPMTRRLRVIVSFASGVTAVVALLDIVGWLVPLPVLASFSSRFVPMAPSTAVEFLAFAAILPFANPHRAKVVERIVFAIACVVAISEIVALAGHLPVTIESIALRSPHFRNISRPPQEVLQQMSPVTAVVFLLAALSRLGRWRVRFLRDVQGILGLVSGIVGVIVVLGYAYGKPFLYAAHVAPVALTTGIAFASLGTALIVSAGTDNLPLRPTAGTSARARMIRAFLPGVPAALMIDAVLAAFLPISTPALAVTVFGLVIVVVVSGSILAASHTLGRVMDRSVYTLTERERELRAIFNGTRDALLIADDEGTFIDANRPAYYLFGLAPHNLLGASFTALLAQNRPDLWPRFLRLRRVDGHVRVLLADGNERDLEYSLTAAILPHRHLVLVRDVTDSRRRAMESERLAAIVASSFDAIYSKDLEGRVVSWNPSAERIFGYSSEEMDGQTEEALFSRGSSGAMRPRLEGEAEEREVIATSKDGRAITVTLSESPIHDDAGRIIGTSVIARDVTAHRQAQVELQQSEARFNLMFEFSPVAIGLSDAKSGRLIAVNSKWCELFQYEPAEAVGLTSFELGLWDDIADRDRLMDRLSEHSQSASIDVRVRRKSGEIRHAIISMTSTMLAAVAEKVLIVTVIDTTKRRELESQLAQSQKMEAVGRLAGGVAHDFNNMLGVILGFSELLEQSLSESDRRKIEQVIKAARRAAGLTNQLLAFSRKQLLEPRILNLNELVSGTASMLKHLIGEDIYLKTDFAQEIGRVRADPGQLEQVIMNLAVNARDAMPGGGTLSIGTENAEIKESFTARDELVAQGPYVKITISDTGTGIDEETLEHIFEPFFTTKEQGKGTGLGLSTVYGIIKQSMGYVAVMSEIGEGTTFEIYLPRVDLPAERSAEAEAAAESTGTETVLLVEDEAPLRMMICEVLAERGYSVLSAGNAQKAIEIAQRRKTSIRLLITDVIMPGMGGPELAERLLSLVPGLKVLFISGYTADLSDLDQLLADKARLLSKPFSNNALLVRVRQLLDEPE